LGSAAAEQGVSKDVYVVKADELFNHNDPKKRAVLDLNVSTG
jgi:hypothetical protein